MKRQAIHILATLLCGLSVSSAWAAGLEVANVFGDAMVLQRGRPIPVWGRAEPGQAVRITLGDQSKRAEADDTGLWMAKLPARSAGGPHVMTVQAGEQRVSFDNVLIGDVWVSCGQSNMQFALRKSDHASQALATAAKRPDLRFFKARGTPRADEPAEDIEGQWFGGDGNSLGGFSAVSVYFALALRERVDVPIGVVNVGAIVPAEAWVDPQTLRANPRLAPLFDHPLDVAGKSYQGMIRPLQPYAIKGVIYYQAEYNGGRYKQYRELFPALIRSWRETWGQGEFPFLFVQLPGFEQHRAGKDEKLDMDPSVLNKLHKPGGAERWAPMRQTQLEVWQEVPNTGMAVTIDVGDPYNIHPRRKKPVGQRLALQALKVAYGRDLVASGPIFKSLRRDGRELVVRFDHVAGGLAFKGDDPGAGFAIAGADQRYVWADARIAGQGDRVIVSAEQVPEPVYVRYAWAGYPRFSLYNDTGLPAAPFRAAVEGAARQVDRFTIALPNASFEQAGDDAATPAQWRVLGGAQRTDARASDGRWSVRIPAGNAKLVITRLIPPRDGRFDWNSDLLKRASFRPGMLLGYQLDLASAGDKDAMLYANLAANDKGGAWRYFNDRIPKLPIAAGDFKRVSIAMVTQPRHRHIVRSSSIGGRWVNLAKTDSATLFLDNFSEITCIRPKLTVSETEAIRFNPVAAGATAQSKPLSIVNSQQATWPHVNRDGSTTERATVLYGTANLESELHRGLPRGIGQTDHVGAVIIGADKARFAFVSEHHGASERELKLIGTDGAPGLAGGAEPEAETFRIRYTGGDTAGPHRATLRIVTQAGNTGSLSRGGDGEPMARLFYVDIPLVAEAR